jgi:hypothetical protein
VSTLTSASTDAQVWAAYDDNASYEEDSSRAKALAFVTACRLLLRRRPRGITRAGISLQFDEASIREEMKQARIWLALHPGTAATRERFASFEDFRQ